jgi:hypothetical protein
MPCTCSPATGVGPVDGLRHLHGVLDYMYMSVQSSDRVCRDAHPMPPSERRVGRTARMTMLFGYVGDAHWCIRFAMRHARASLGWWPAIYLVVTLSRGLSPLHAVVTQSLNELFLSHTLSLGMPHLACIHHGKDTASTQRSTSRQQPR